MKQEHLLPKIPGLGRVGLQDRRGRPRIVLAGDVEITMILSALGGKGGANPSSPPFAIFSLVVVIVKGKVKMIMLVLKER